MNIFITGGTSGIGLALARFYAAKGHRVGVCGRNTARIDRSDEVNKLLLAYQLDVCDKDALTVAVEVFCADKGLDMMIVAAGYYRNGVTEEVDFEQTSQMLKVNIAGALNAMEVAREAMNASGGHLVVIASVAGLLHYPCASVYAKCKRALIQIADAYRQSLADYQITVTTLVPGYIDTPRLREIYRNDLSKCPFCMPLNRAVETMTKAIAQRKEQVVFPPKMRLSIAFLSLLPTCLFSAFMHRKTLWSIPK